MDHDLVVTERFLKAENACDLNSSYWDECFREEEYFEDYVGFLDWGEGSFKGRCVGELDVVLVNYGNRVMYVEEVKTSYGDLSYASEQLERAERFFGDLGWEVIGSTVLEQG